MKKLVLVLVVSLMVSMFACDDYGEEITPVDTTIKTFAYHVSSSNGSEKPMIKYTNAVGMSKTICPTLPWSFHSTVAVSQMTGKTVYYQPKIIVYNLTDKTEIEVTLFLNGEEYATQTCDDIYCLINLTAPENNEIE